MQTLITLTCCLFAMGTIVYSMEEIQKGSSSINPTSQPQCEGKECPTGNSGQPK